VRAAFRPENRARVTCKSLGGKLTIGCQQSSTVPKPPLSPAGVVGYARLVSVRAARFPGRFPQPSTAITVFQEVALRHIITLVAAAQAAVPSPGRAGVSDFCNVIRSWIPALGGIMACFTALLTCAVILADLPESANSPLLFLKIFISIVLLVCFVVLVLRAFGRLLLDLLGISDGRAPRSNDRYA
jgi:hypothetical protein